MAGCNPLLVPLNPAQSIVEVTHSEFVIGRAKSASFDIKALTISRTHCIFRLKDDTWTICDKSSSGTLRNEKHLQPNEDTALADGDHLDFGCCKEFTFIFCTGGSNCSNACSSRRLKANTGLDAELQQRRRMFDFNASLERSGLEKSIMDKQRDQRLLANEQQKLRHYFVQQMTDLEQRYGEKQRQLEKTFPSGGSSSKLSDARRLLEAQLVNSKRVLEEEHAKEIASLADEIKASQAAEEELRRQNQLLQERLQQEKEQFEKRLEDERKQMEARLQEQLAEQKRLVTEKAEVEEALRLRIENLEKVAGHEEEEQQRQAQLREQEKNELEQKLKEVELKLKEKEEQERIKELELQERDRELREREEQIEQERRDRDEQREAEFREKELAKEREYKEREEERQREREAELQRLAEEREHSFQNALMLEQCRLQEELRKREEQMRQQLAAEVSKLESEKVAIEQRIRGELSKKEGENEETVKQMTNELDQVKRDLKTINMKRTVLEKELEEASKAKEAASQNGLQVRRDVIDNFGNLMETELQCSICSELFVAAVTLNCSHTFCRVCISDWLRKKRDCPICRAAVTQESRSVVLDSFIDKMVENLSEEMKVRRKAIVDERKARESSSHRPVPSKKRKHNQQQAPPPPPLPIPAQQISNNQSVQVLRAVTVMRPNPQGAVHFQTVGTTSVAGSVNNRSVRLPSASLTSQVRPTNSAVAGQLRPQRLQTVRPLLVHPLSSVQNLRTQMPPHPRVLTLHHQQNVHVLQVAGAATGGSAGGAPHQVIIHQRNQQMQQPSRTQR